MNDLIESIAAHREIAIFVIGLLLIIGAITKGGISLGSFEIPKVETGQAKLLGGLGFSLILLALFLVTRPEAKNNHPTASNYSKTIMKGEMLMIPILDHVEDEDKSDTLKISIVEDANLGSTSLKNNNIEYVGENKGRDLFTYQVSDGKGGRDTANIQITVKPLPAKLVTRKGQLINVFGKPKSGQYKIDLKNEKQSSSDSLITANELGEFGLRTNEENELCKIFMYEKENPTNFFLRYKEEVKTVEYNPLDSIVITFCRDYEKTKEEPIDPFKDRFNIPFEKLTKDSVATYEYGILYLGVKYFGSNIKEERGKLNFYFIQKNRDKTIYDPVKITSGSMAGSINGWDSNMEKKLLRGEYDLEIKSPNGTSLKTIEFEIK